jgi:hypothetical protein
VRDFKGGLTFLRVMADTAVVLDVEGEAFRAKQFSSPFTGPGELAATWSGMGLKEVVQTSLTIRMEFSSFADYWMPWLGGQGPVGAYVTSLNEENADCCRAACAMPTLPAPGTDPDPSPRPRGRSVASFEKVGSSLRAHPAHIPT